MSEKQKHYLWLAASAVNWTAVLAILPQFMDEKWVAIAGVVIQSFLPRIQKTATTIITTTPMIEQGKETQP